MKIHFVSKSSGSLLRCPNDESNSCDFGFHTLFTVSIQAYKSLILFEYLLAPFAISSFAIEFDLSRLIGVKGDILYLAQGWVMAHTDTCDWLIGRNLEAALELLWGLVAIFRRLDVLVTSIGILLSEYELNRSNWIMNTTDDGFEWQASPFERCFWADSLLIDALREHEFLAVLTLVAAKFQLTQSALCIGRNSWWRLQDCLDTLWMSDWSDNWLLRTRCV